MNRKKIIQPILYAVPLVIIVILLFNIYTLQNKERIAEQNKNYAEDAVRKTAQQIADEFENGLNLINTYAHFLEKSMDKPEIGAQTLKEMEMNSIFDTVRFTDAEGKTHTSDGGTTDSSDREYYECGMNGESGISVIFDARLSEEETRVLFYSPIRFEGEIIGIIRGSFVAEQYLREILQTTYFGEVSNTWLCMADGRVIASSDGMSYDERKLTDILQEEGYIDGGTAQEAEAVFEKGGEGSFICGKASRTDNLCVKYLPNSEYVLVQTFPPKVTQGMIGRANAAGIRLEISLLVLCAVYFLIVIIRAAKQRKVLEEENRQVNYVLNGLNTLFSSKYLTVDLETGSYFYTAGVKLLDNQQMAGGDYANVIKLHSSEIIGEEEQENFRQTFGIASVIENLSDQDTFTYECHVMRDGKEEWEQLTTVCLERKEGRASRILYVRQNISEMKRRELKGEEELSVMNRKERQYRIAITSTAFSTFEFNLTKDLVEQDIVCAKGGGQISVLEKVGLTAPCKVSECFERWRQYVLPESLEEYDKVVDVAYLQNAFEQGEAEIDIDYWGKAGDGGQMCVRQSFFMTRDDNTDDIVVMVVSRDITEQVIEQRQQTQALQDALMHARQANEAKTTFLSNMSHDIRTPMNAIVGMTAIATSNIDNPAIVQDSLRKITLSSKHLLGLINDVLDISKIETGKLTIGSEQICLQNFMENVITIAQPMIKEKNMRFDIFTKNILCENIYSDSIRLNQVMINLLSNALKYTPENGQVTMTLSQQESPKGDNFVRTHFWIKDNGIGMTEEFQQIIYDAFVRADNKRVKQIEGTGLGMAISKYIIDAMDGTIELHSEVNQGTEFHVILDFEKASVSEDDMVLPNWNLLLVDDDEELCRGTATILQEIGIHAEYATTGTQALQMIKEKNDPQQGYQIVLLDYKMPDIDGIETAKQMRQYLGEEIPILLISAYDWSDIEKDAKTAGITAFVTKPLFKSTLYHALKPFAEDAGTTKETPEEPTFDFSGRHLLVAEDHEINWEICEALLSAQGFILDWAENGQICVDTYKASDPSYYDAILMDLRMPVMDGYQATELIRSSGRPDADLPIIAMTADAFAEDVQQCLEKGMNAHVAKPINVPKLLQILQKYFQ